MATTIGEPKAAARDYADLHDHLRTLDAAGLLQKIDAPINRDTELMPLVRWQFRGGIPEAGRKAFLFTNVVDQLGRRFDIPVVVGAFAATPAIYALGMGVPVDQIGPVWERAIAHPIPPVEVTDAPCQERVIEGRLLRGEGNGLDALPVPISTPGFDVAPYLTATGCITRDPETGVQNMGTYRGAIKSSRRIGLKMFVHMGQGGFAHWNKYRARGQPMPMAIALGGPPAVAYVGPQKLALGVDELAVAGGIIGKPLNVVKARTVDLLVPAEAEIVIEGHLDPEYMEPEGPFGES
ncbi:MAG: UbiD family decarboxylase, partial [Alphaproteobacteria bacterium]